MIARSEQPHLCARKIRSGRPQEGLGWLDLPLTPQVQGGYPKLGDPAQKVASSQRNAPAGWSQ